MSGLGQIDSSNRKIALLMAKRADPGER